MKKLILFIIFGGGILLNLSAFAQVSKVDSLQKLLKKYPKDDTNKVILLSELAEAYLKNYQYKQGLLTNQEIHTISKKLQYQKGEGFYLQNLGFFHRNNQMLLYYQWQAIDIFEALGDKKAIKKPLSILSFENQPKFKDLKIDSLQNALSFYEKRQDRVMQADILQVMAVEYFHQNQFEKAIEYGNKAMQFYEFVENDVGIVCATFNLIHSFEKQGKKTQAIDRELALTKLTDKIKGKKALAFSLYLISWFYSKESRYDLAYDYAYKSFNLGIENDQVLKCYTMGSLAILQDIAQISKSGLFQQYIDEIEKVRNDSRMELANILLPITQYQMLCLEGKFEEAQLYIEKAKVLAEKTNNKFGFSSIYDALGQISQKQGKYQEAITYLLRAIEYGKEIGEWWSVAYQKSHIALCYQSLGKLPESIQYGLEARQLAIQSDLGDVQITTARTLAQNYGKLRQYKEANLYYQIYDSLQERLTNQNLERKFADIEIQNTVKKSQQEITLLEKDKQIQAQINHNQRLWLFSAMGALFSVLVLAFVLYRNNQNKQKANKLLSEQKEEIKATLDLVEQERQKSDNLLLNILPEETAQELKATGTATPKHYDLVSVLFTDFKGFTQISEKLEPQQVIEELNKCFLAFDEICEKHNLEKIKTIGDSYMCAGGIPIANTSNPMDCVQAGLEMQTWMANWKAEKQAKGELAWELRLGIHSGVVVAGVIGKNKFAYDIWGDAVNLASRMESSGEAGKVNISGATYELVKDKFQCTYRGKIEAKNKGEVEMYFVEGIL